MSLRGALRMALWTEIREALLKDFGSGLQIPMTAPPHLAEVIKCNADYIAELAEGTK